MATLLGLLHQMARQEALRRQQPADQVPIAREPPVDGRHRQQLSGIAPGVPGGLEQRYASAQRPPAG